MILAGHSKFRAVDLGLEDISVEWTSSALDLNKERKPVFRTKGEKQNGVRSKAGDLRGRQPDGQSRCLWFLILASPKIDLPLDC